MFLGSQYHPFHLPIKLLVGFGIWILPLVAEVLKVFVVIREQVGLKLLNAFDFCLKLDSFLLSISSSTLGSLQGHACQRRRSKHFKRRMRSQRYWTAWFHIFFNLYKLPKIIKFCIMICLKSPAIIITLWSDPFPAFTVFHQMILDNVCVLCYPKVGNIIPWYGWKVWCPNNLISVKTLCTCICMCVRNLKYE